MPKTFYTQHDIQDLAAEGVTRLEISDDVVLTDLAREQAMKVGMELVRSPSPPAPTPDGEKAAVRGVEPASARTQLHERVRSAVIAKLGGEVDSALLDRIVTRVLSRL